MWKKIMQDLINEYGYIVCGNIEEVPIGKIIPRIINGNSNKDDVTHPFKVISKTDYYDWMKQRERGLELAKQYKFTYIVNLIEEDIKNPTSDYSRNYYYKIITD